MTTVTRLLTVLSLVSLIAGSAGVASARELDSYQGDANTSLSATPVGTTTLSSRKPPRAKDQATIPAKYDSAFPVRDYAHATRDRGAI